MSGRSEHSEEAHDFTVLSELPTKEALAAHVTRSPALPPQKISPVIASTSLLRPQQDHRPSCASRVDVDFFDPDGVRNLNRTLSHMSAGRVVDDAQSFSAISDDTLITDGPFDFERTLRTMMKRWVPVTIVCLMAADCVLRRKEADILPRELGVMFQNLKVVGIGAAASFQPTLGSILNPKMIIEQLRTMRHPPLRDIISGFEGVIRPGEMLRRDLLEFHLL